ncbi:MAG: ABC transporter permease [Nocardioidaceae bacterium]|nr:ABC transporter permease [Nocardioidaceae bacterium]MCL2613142.1 ABC transporter permease [Nocardioidaceae bacterium]
MWNFIHDRRSEIAFNTYQHALLVFYAVVIATILAVVIAVVITRIRGLDVAANQVSAIALTIPSFALVGLLLPVVHLGPTIGLVAVAFYAVWPILRNAVVGLQGVDPILLESARGMGMSEATVLWRVRLPLAWPVILAGIRISTQMSMGIAAIASYALGPGLGTYIFTGLSKGGVAANGLNYTVVAIVGIVVVALIADGLLVLLGRLTVSKGIR